MSGSDESSLELPVPSELTLTSEAADHPGFQHTGIEFMHMLEGAMVYRYADASMELPDGTGLDVLRLAKLGGLPVTGMQVGQSIHISQITLPEGVSPEIVINLVLVLEELNRNTS